MSANTLTLQHSTTPSVSRGMPVELGKIERELKKLWDQGGEVMTRASLVNLAVYSEAPDSLAANTQIVAQLTEEHSCRALVIAATPSESEEKVEAWISAHCHVTRAGSKHVCSEQISFALTGSCAQLLANIVFSHLDTDLPLYLWWQSKLPDEIDPHLWSWVDRLIYDSRDWDDFRNEMRILDAAREESNQRLILCDLNWTRLVRFRLALAQFFDQPANLEHLGAIERVELDFSPGHERTALLLVGWLAAQLGWMASDSPSPDQIRFTDPCGANVSIALRETEGDPISRCSLFSGAAEFRVVNPPEADLLEVSQHANGRAGMRRVMPAVGHGPVALMREELMRGGAHRVYLRAVEAVEHLL